MIRYNEKIIVPSVNERRTKLKLPKTQPALAKFDCFKGQTTTKVKELLRMYDIRFIAVPVNCTNK